MYIYSPHSTFRFSHCIDCGGWVCAGTLALGTVPGGQTVFAEFVPDAAWADPAGVGALAGVVGAVALEFAFAGFGLLDVALFDTALEVDPLCAVFPAAGMHAIPPELAGVAGTVPCGAGLAVVGTFCGFVPGVGAGAALWVSGPAAFVVIGVGGPMAVDAGAAVLGVAGAAEGAGAAAAGAGAAAGGGTPGRP